MTTSHVLLWLLASIALSLCIGTLLHKYLYLLEGRQLRRKIEKRSNISVLPTEILPAPIPQEIYSDSDGFALLGEQWAWLRNVPVSYGCPECDQWIKTDGRDYLHKPTGYTFSVLRHKCNGRIDTLPLAAVDVEVAQKTGGQIL